MPPPRATAAAWPATTAACASSLMTRGRTSTTAPSATSAGSDRYGSSKADCWFVVSSNMSREFKRRVKNRLLVFRIRTASKESRDF